jgi:hypothetical protein
MLKAMAKPEKEKKAKRWAPGTTPSKKKQSTAVEVTVVCECCGATETEIRTLELLPDSPTTMRLPVSLCNSCPDYFRAMTHEELVCLALVRRHAGLMHQCPRDSSQVKYAKRHTAEEIVSLRLNHF